MASTPRPRRDPLAFDRSDRWGLIGLLVVVALAALWAWLVGPLLAWVRGDAIPLELTSEVSVPALEASGLRPGPATYEVLVRDPGVGQRLLGLAPGVLYLAIVLVTCWAVWRLMRSVAAGDPFQPANVTRLRAVAAALVLGTSVAFFLEMAARGALTTTIDSGDLSPGVWISVPCLPLVTGMVAALLAEAFKAGSRLREDVQGLV
jgi:hypothetical protein